MNKRHFPIIIEQDEDGVYIVSCPVLKGCHSFGKTIDEAIDNIKEAIELCLEDEEYKNDNKFIGLQDIEVNISETIGI